MLHNTTPTDKYEAWRTALAKCLAHTEAVIDFGDDDDSVDDSAFSAIRPKVKTNILYLHLHYTYMVY
jgi:tRNA U34 5-carboxymethylaminomethyl modifying GTPase MnmE/TrmE